jgi:formate dehydrogenase iron-sulfur subunit
MSLGIGVAVLAGFFHYVTAGPKEVEEKETD